MKRSYRNPANNLPFPGIADVPMCAHRPDVDPMLTWSRE